MTLPILILAAGQSSRMGGSDKLLLDIDGAPMLRRMAQVAIRADIGPVVVGLPPAPHARYAALEGLDLDILPVPDAAEGMNTTLRDGLSHIPADAPAAMILLADLPDLTAADLRAVAQARRDHPQSLIWRGATAQGKPGHPVVFDRSLFDEIKALSGDRGARDVIKAHNADVHLVPLPHRHALSDIDTPEDFRRWQMGR